MTAESRHPTSWTGESASWHRPFDDAMDVSQAVHYPARRIRVFGPPAGGDPSARGVFPDGADEWIVRVLTRYASQTALHPGPHVVRRITDRIVAEPRPTPPRRFVAALGARDVRAAWRGFGTLLAAALGRVPAPAPLRAQALSVVLATVVVLTGGAVAGVTGAGLLLSAITSGLEATPPPAPELVDRPPAPAPPVEAAERRSRGPDARVPRARRAAQERTTRSTVRRVPSDGSAPTVVRSRERSESTGTRSRSSGSGRTTRTGGGAGTGSGGGTTDGGGTGGGITDGGGTDGGGTTDGGGSGGSTDGGGTTDGGGSGGGTTDGGTVGGGGRTRDDDDDDDDDDGGDDSDDGDSDSGG